MTVDGDTVACTLDNELDDYDVPDEDRAFQSMIFLPVIAKERVRCRVDNIFIGTSHIVV